MRYHLLTCLALLASASLGGADTITLNNFNNNTPATVTFVLPGGMSGVIDTNLTQFNVTYSAPGSNSTFNTFSVDLLHTVSAGQTYLVDLRNDLASAFANGSRMAFIYQNFGTQDLTNNADQAAAVQVAIWDLMSNHSPTFFGPDPDGTYSSGDENVFNVDFGNNPDASQIAALTDQYLKASFGSTAQGAWLDASPAGDASNRGESVLFPISTPSSIVLVLVAVGGLVMNLLSQQVFSRGTAS
jgi:hypothetical protein